MNLASSLIDRILTYHDAREAADKLGAVISKSWQNNQTFEGLLKDYFDKETLLGILDSLKESVSQKTDRLAALKELKENLESLPNIRLTVAISPTLSMVENLSRLVREEVNPAATLEFDIDPKIIGGAVIINNGKVFDLSLKKKVDLFFEKNVDRLTKKIKDD